MKKSSFIFLFFILSSLCLSQEFNDKLKNSRMGLYISPSINFIQTDSDHTETNSNPGVVYGYALEVSLNENHYLESGFSITYKGGGITENLIGGNTNTDYKVQYISLPLFIKMRSRQIGYFNYFARIGPSINFKIKDMISSETKAKGAAIDIAIFLGAEYSLGGKTSIEGSLFFNNNITNAINNDYLNALFHQFGIRLGFLF